MPSTLTIACAAAFALAFASHAVNAQAPQISAAERAAVLKAAGATQLGGRWVICTEDPNTGGAVVDRVDDLNGDGRPEAVVSEDGTFCNGHAGLGFVLLTKAPAGGWTVVHQSSGIPQFLVTKGAGGWPDIEVGGPGFCFPVLRWNGREYALERRQYEGKACSAP